MWLHKYPWDEETCASAAAGHLGPQVGARRAPLGQGDVRAGGSEGQLECLEWAREHGCPGA